MAQRRVASQSADWMGDARIEIRRWAPGIAGLLLALLAAWQIHTAAQGLGEVRATPDGVPVVIIGPAGAMDGSRPLVLIGHGLAGSDRKMRDFAYTFSTGELDAVSGICYTPDKPVNGFRGKATLKALTTSGIEMVQYSLCPSTRARCRELLEVGRTISGARRRNTLCAGTVLREAAPETGAPGQDRQCAQPCLTD